MGEAELELVRDWLTRAHQDLRAAIILAAAENAPLDVAIYHCQQAGEKAANLEKGFDALEKPAEILTPYVSAFRYPGGSDELMPERKEFDEALHHARTIYDFVLTLLPAEARP